MEKDKIIEVAKNAQHKSNKDLIEARDELFKEFETTKNLIIDLTRHLDSVEEMYNNVNKEIGNRLSK